jgi:hypothetical protein
MEQMSTETNISLKFVGGVIGSTFFARVGSDLDLESLREKFNLDGKLVYDAKFAKT